jgi:hypothetical protein
MSSLYTPQVREYIYSRNWPKGLILEVYEDDEPAPHLNIVFFRDNWLTLEPEQHQQVVTIVKQIMAKLWADGIPTYTGKMESAYHGRSGLAT